MDRDSIITLPNTHLRQKSLKVTVFDEELLRLSQAMQSAALDWEDHRQHELGVALAAVQVDVLRRLVVIRSDFDNKEDRSFVVFVNPKIIRLEGKEVEDLEGCLSVPDLYGKVKRRERVKIKAQDVEGNEFRMTADGFLARVLQHEIDHTNGLLFIDYIKDKRDAYYNLSEDGKLEQINYETLDTANFLW